MVKIGDLIQKAGIFAKPGVVTQKNDDGTVKIDTEPLSINKYHRYTNTTGLNEAEKNKFNAIMDSVYSTASPETRVDEIQKEIDSLAQDPANHEIVRFLKNQQRALIRDGNKIPRSYTWDEGTLDKTNRGLEYGGK